MPRISGRSNADTQALILNAAAELVLELGLQASLDKIALRAGVSKGGLTYHYPSKAELFEALALTIVEAFHQDVENELDESDQQPGRLARAYIRASAASRTTGMMQRDRWTVLPLLCTIDTVQHLLREDSLGWKAAMQADGLPADVRDLVITSADGISITTMWGDAYDSDQIAHLTSRLIALTYENECGDRHAV